jgi:hypothetical protein
VRISFTVDLDEVPERISLLVKEAEATMNIEALRLARAASDLLDNGNVKTVLDGVNNARLSLMDIDLRLQDCQSLLTSYQTTQLELTLQQQDEGQQEEEQQASEE